MNKKPARSGPRIRLSRSASRFGKLDDIPINPIDERKFIYHCQYCRVKFTHNSHFFRHMMTNHEIQQRQATYQCNNCQIKFSKKCLLDLHCQTQHQVKSKSRCESCAITFKSRYCLRRHLKLKQTLLENSCLKCHKKFTTKDHLQKHVRNKHTFKNALFQCEVCSLKFKAKESLQSHQNRIHKKL